ncbi:MAG TPA: 4Fe-4S binding protein, partial [Synergistetes bacterium]|nr:4Fe-4S binding protein [Synergistota bacterium]
MTPCPCGVYFTLQEQFKGGAAVKSSKLRYVIQFGFLAFMTWLGYRHQVLGGGPEGVPTVDALCPFGGLESLYSILASGTWLRRLAPSAMVLLVVLIAMTLLLGRVFCGWICPLGT